MGENKTMITFNKTYFGFALLLFSIEVVIAFFVNVNFVRPYRSDVLVVILIYCFLKSFVQLLVQLAAIAVLLFSFTIEFLQYLHSIEKLGLENSKIAQTVIGTFFSWMDLLAYCTGIGIVMGIEKYCHKKMLENNS